MQRQRNVRMGRIYLCWHLSLSMVVVVAFKAGLDAGALNVAGHVALYWT